MLIWALIILIALAPLANYISFAMAMRRSEARRRARRLAMGLPTQPSNRRAWKNYTHHVARGRYND